jgi:hypothetical protein
MEIDENEFQLLGAMKLNGLELYDTVGNQCSKSPTYIECKRLTGSHTSDAVNSP